MTTSDQCRPLPLVAAIQLRGSAVGGPGLRFRRRRGHPGRSPRPGTAPIDTSAAWPRIFVVLFVLGLQSVARSVPVRAQSRRQPPHVLPRHGAACVSLAAVYGLILTVLQVVERGTNGWGMTMDFFRVPYILKGSWYLTWLTASVALALLFVYGMWFGLVFRRWSMVGLVAFLAGQVTVLVVGTLVSTWTHAWHQIGHFFSALSATGLTGVLAALAAALLAGGFVTMRRVTV